MVGATVDAAPASLSEQLALLRLRKWWVIGVAAAAIAGAVGLTSLQDRLYVSEAQVHVRPVASAGTLEIPNMTTERELARSSAVATIASNLLGGATAPADLIEALDVDVITDTEILRFRASAPNAFEARDRTQAFADAYLRFRRQQAREESTAAQAAIREELTLQQAQLKSVNQRIADASDVERTSLEAQQIALATEIGSLRTQLAELQSADVRAGQIVRAAEAPSGPASPKPMRAGLLGALVGFALGIAAAFLADRLDDRLQRPESIELIVGAPTLSIVPRIPQSLRDQGPVALRHAEGHYAEAFRTLRTGLMFAAGNVGARTIMVASANPGEGKTHTTANLGIALAQAGKRVVLVSADLRRPELHRYFGLEASPGLAEVVAQRGDIWAALQRPRGVENLWILTSGSAGGSAADLLSSRGAQDVIHKLRDSADFVIIDTGPITSVADALILAPSIDGVVLVISSERTTRSTLRHARKQLGLVSANVLGSVLNNFRPRAASQAYTYASTYAEVDERETTS